MSDYETLLKDYGVCSVERDALRLKLERYVEAHDAAQAEIKRLLIWSNDSHIQDVNNENKRLNAELLVEKGRAFQFEALFKQERDLSSSLSNLYNGRANLKAVGDMLREVDQLKAENENLKVTILVSESATGVINQAARIKELEADSEKLVAALVAIEENTLKLQPNSNFLYLANINYCYEKAKEALKSWNDKYGKKD